MSHVHTCPSCGTGWRHCDDRFVGDVEAHSCPNCGAVQWEQDVSREVGNIFGDIWGAIKDLPKALKDTPGLVWELVSSDEGKAFLRDVGMLGAGIATGNPALISAGAYSRYESMTGDEVPPEIKAGISAATKGESIDWEAGLTASGKEALARIAAANPEALGAIAEMVNLAETKLANAKAQAVALYGASKKYQSQAKKALEIAKYYRDKAGRRKELFS